MADGTINVADTPAAQSTKKLDTTSLTVSALTVQRERMVIAGAADLDLSAVTRWNCARTQLDSSQLFIDTFDASLDTTDRWAASTTGSGGSAFVFSTASMTGGSGTTASGFSMIATRATFQPSAPGLLEFQENINIEFPVLLNNLRFWGFATAPATPTAAAPLTNAMGFEIGITGKLFAVTYQSGARVAILDLSSSGSNVQPADSSAHKYWVYMRGDVAYWAIDTRDNIVATMPTGANGPDVTALTIRNLTVNHTTPPSSSCTLVVNATILGDTAGNNIAICDPTFPWRQQTVKDASTAAVAADLAAVVALSPNTPVGTKTNNNAAPGATNVGTLPGLANANLPAWTEGNQVALSTDLNGRLRVTTGDAATYSASSNGTISSGTAASTTVSLGYLFHPSAVTTLQYKAGRFKVSWDQGVAGNAFLLKLGRITAENGAPGGTSQTIQAHNPGSASSSAVFRTGATGAPTRGTVIETIVIHASTPGFYEFDLTGYENGKGWEARQSQAEGWEVLIVTGATAPTTASIWSVNGTWVEQT